MWERRFEAPEITKKLKALLTEDIERKDPPNSIWLSDTVYCGRKKLFHMKNICPRFSEEDITRLWLGKTIGSSLENIGIAKEVTVEYRGYRGRVDCIAESGEPVEIKVTTSKKVTESKYAEVHVEQLSRYCLAMGVETGILLYYVPNVKLSNLPAYRYEFKLDKVREITDARLDILEHAVENNDPFLVPPTWHSDTMDNWECRRCTYKALCITGGELE